MSFLACIGHLMEETGLHDVLSTVYAPNAVNHMLHGKAVLRAVRGHFLVDAALNTLLMSDTFRVPLSQHECESEMDEPEENSSRPTPLAPTRLQVSLPQTQDQTDGTADEQEENVHTHLSTETPLPEVQTETDVRQGETQGNDLENFGLYGEVELEQVTKHELTHDNYERNSFGCGE
jgi:hypothetical protein